MIASDNEYSNVRGKAPARRLNGQGAQLRQKRVLDRANVIGKRPWKQFKPRQIGFKAHSKRFAVEFATRRMDLHRVEFGSKASAQASLFDLNGQVNAACDRCKIERAGNKLKLSFPMNRVSRRSKTAALDTRAELKQSGFFRGSSASLQTMPIALV